MKEHIWGRVTLAKLEAWGLLLTGLFVGIILAICSETSHARFVAKQVERVTDYQMEIVQATTSELSIELELNHQARVELQEKIANTVQSCIIEELNSLVAEVNTKNGFLIGIDPGHLGRTYQGYVNVGAVSVNGITEYEFALEVGVLLKEELISRGYEVLMIRETNDRKGYKLTPGDRAIVANEAGCDAVIALHWDSNDDPTHHGYHTIYKGNKQTESYRLALAVSDAYGAAVEGYITKLRKPMKRTDLWQLNWSTVPMTFIEMGYASNESDAMYLTNSENYPTIVEGIANGIDNYFAGETE